MFKKEANKSISRKEFKKYIKRWFLFRALLLGMFFSALYLNYFHAFIKTEKIYGLFGALLLISFFLERPERLQQRFRGIYPQKNLGVFKLMVSLVSPLYFFILIAALLLKKSNNFGLKLAFVFSKRFAGIMVAATLGFQFTSFGSSYWTTGATFHYLVQVSKGSSLVSSLTAEHEKIENESSSLIDEYLIQKGVRPTNIEIILLAGAYSDNFSKNVGRKVSDEKSIEERTAKIKKTLKALKDVYQILSLSERSRFGMWGFNPVQWFTPSGMIEITFLSFVEFKGRSSSNKALLQAGIEGISALEKSIKKLPDHEQNLFMKEADSLKDRFQKSKAFKSFL